jgi:hypothetical protein
VILEGVPKPAKKTFSLVPDVQLRLILGEKVLVKAEGIDAQLGGIIDLEFRSLDKIASKGEIRVVKGRYRAFGADLEIVRGRLFYAGGPINQPTLDIQVLFLRVSAWDRRESSRAHRQLPAITNSPFGRRTSVRRPPKAQQMCLLLRCPLLLLASASFHHLSMFLLVIQAHKLSLIRSRRHR